MAWRWAVGFKSPVGHLYGGFWAKNRILRVPWKLHFFKSENNENCEKFKKRQNSFVWAPRSPKMPFLNFEVSHFKCILENRVFISESSWKLTLWKPTTHLPQYFAKKKGIPILKIRLIPSQHYFIKWCTFDIHNYVMKSHFIYKK